MLEQITDDTKVRKSQTKKIKLFSVGFVILSLIILVLSYKSIYSEEILTSSQIESIKLTDRGEILVTTNLPFIVV